jgi:ethanolamine utilization protein EutN
MRRLPSADFGLPNENGKCESAIGNRQSEIGIGNGASMFLARVTGNVVATQKDKSLNGQKLFVVEPLNVKYDEHTKAPASLGNTGRAIVALDSVGAGEGQLVLVVQGSSARMTDQTKTLPADAVIVGIVDSAEFGGKTFYRAQE